MKMKVGELAKLVDVDPHDLEPWGKEELPMLYKNEHSWAGDQGCTAKIVKATGEIIHLEYGGWYSENGRITRDEPDTDPYEELYLKGAEEGDILVVHQWNHYNRPSQEFSNLYYYKVKGSDIERGKNKRQEILEREI